MHPPLSRAYNKWRSVYLSTTVSVAFNAGEEASGTIEASVYPGSLIYEEASSLYDVDVDAGFECIMLGNSHIERDDTFSHHGIQSGARISVSIKRRPPSWLEIRYAYQAKQWREARERERAAEKSATSIQSAARMYFSRRTYLSRST